MRRAALALLLSVLAAAPAWAGYEKAVLAYDQGRFREAFAEFQELADRGDRGAEFMLGAMHFYGKGVRRDDAAAAIWFHKAALKGDPKAQLAFGSLHIRGLGVRQDLVKAYMWLTVSADHGVPGLQQQAVTLREEASRLMRPDEVERARRLAADWRPQRSGLIHFDE
jgi:TPR repeat protein